MGHYKFLVKIMSVSPVSWAYGRAVPLAYGDYDVLYVCLICPARCVTMVDNNTDTNSGSIRHGRIRSDGYFAHTSTCSNPSYNMICAGCLKLT